LRSETVLKRVRFTRSLRTGPFLNIVTPREPMRTIVEPTLRGEGPSSTTASILSPRQRHTIFALVHGGYPVRFALVPVRSPPHLCINLKAISCLGHLTAIVLRPRVSRFGNRSLGLSTNVSGPGQNFDANAIARRSITAIRPAIAVEATRIGNGFFLFPLTAMTRLRARRFRGSHPKP
jgi:hypothetical protein